MVNFWTKKTEQIGLIKALKDAAGINDGEDGTAAS